MLFPAVAFFVALSLLFAGCGETGSDGGHSYFVQLNIERNSLFVDGEMLSVSEYRELMQELKELVNGLEDDLSVELSDSDLSRINGAAAGESVFVSEDTWEALSLAFRFSEQENNRFSPALFPLTQLWGFAPQNEGHYGDARPAPDEAALFEARRVSDCSLFELGENHSVTKSDSGAKLDLGGIAKGYMSDRVAAYIRNKYAGRRVDGIIEVMSNTVLLGQKIQADVVRDYNIGIDNPRNLLSGGSKSTALFIVGLSDVSVTTSADNYRFYVYEDKIYPHIIDAETGRPADRGIISVTAVVPYSVPNAGAFADSLTTAAFCMPLTQAISFFSSLSESSGAGAVIITSDHKYYTVGDITVLDRGEYASFSNEYLGTDYDLSEFPDSEEVFYKGDVDEASDAVVPCAREIEYIKKIGSSV